MEESIYIKPVSGPCDVHDWPTEGMSERLVAAMRGKGGVNACRDCVVRARGNAEQQRNHPRKTRLVNGGEVPLSVWDATAQDLLWEYAQRRRAVDPAFSADLEAALRLAGYDGNAQKAALLESTFLLALSTVQPPGVLVFDCAQDTPEETLNRMQEAAEHALADMGIRVVLVVRDKFLLGGEPLPEWLQGQALPVIQEILESMGLHAVPRLRVEDLQNWLRDTGWTLSEIAVTGSRGASKGYDAVYFHERPEQVLPDDLLGTFAQMLGTSVRELRETIGGWVGRRGKREFPLPEGGLLACYPDGAVLGPEGSDGRELIAEVPSPLTDKFSGEREGGG